MALFTLLLTAGCATGRDAWPQWGGPNRNFMVDAPDLADQWPEAGPPKLWSRQLGDGFSTIVVDERTVYTLYRDGDSEVVVALERETGATKWEHRYASPFTNLMAEFGEGPHSTPLLVGNRLYTVGLNVVLHCLDSRTGNVLWKHDLVEEYGAEVPGRGYSSSPIAYRNLVILGAGGGDDAGLIAFNKKDGTFAWKNEGLTLAQSSPILIDFHGQDQLVLFTSKSLAGVNPASGELLWSHPNESDDVAALATPLWTGDDLIFVSAAYDSGSRVIRLKREGGKTVPEELWYGRKLRIHHGNAIRIGDYVYGSSGDFGPAILAAVNIRTGDVVWRERGFAKATCVYADGKMILLDEDGQLALLTVSPDGMTVRSKCDVADRTAWAAPTLAGTTLFIRDRKNIMAFDLG
jgi:outer membrane protein assembly factor BamB